MWCVWIAALVALPVWGQAWSNATPLGVRASLGSVRTVEPVAPGEVRPFENGAVLLRLDWSVETGVRLHFVNFHLPAEASVSIYGVDGTGAVLERSGPY